MQKMQHQMNTLVEENLRLRQILSETEASPTTTYAQGGGELLGQYLAGQGLNSGGVGRAAVGDPSATSQMGGSPLQASAAARSLAPQASSQASSAIGSGLPANFDGALLGQLLASDPKAALAYVAQFAQPSAGGVNAAASVNPTQYMNNRR